MKQLFLSKMICFSAIFMNISSTPVFSSDYRGVCFEENVVFDGKSLQRAVQKSESFSSNISKHKRVYQNIMIHTLNTPLDLYTFLISFHFYDFNVEIGESALQQKFRLTTFILKIYFYYVVLIMLQ